MGKMIHELKPHETRKEHQLFAPLSFHLSCAAVLDGVNPGRIFVDDRLTPTAGFVVSPEATYLSGDVGQEDFCNGLASLLQDPDTLGLPAWGLIVVLSSERWLQRVTEIVGEERLARDLRRHYVCENRGDLPELPPPSGAALRRIDEDFLTGSTYDVPEHIEHWILNNWGSREHFLHAGFGVAALCDDAVVSWSLADCVVGSDCEIGIHTAPEWRRKGMAAFTAGGAVRCAFSLGMKSVGWHCHDENIGSWRTAERVGFTLERRYEEYRVMRASG